MYNCGCDECLAQKTTLNLALSDSFKNLLNIGKKAFKHLHEKGSYKPEDLQTEKPYQNLIKSTFDVFDFAIQDNVIDGEMLKSLKNDIYLFSGLKSHAQLFEASRLLLDEKGQIKPLDKFIKDFEKINNSYNQHYLSAEYDYAVGTTQGIARWETFSDDEETYSLQYRVDGGPNMRESHVALNRTTLPKSDPFWNSYTPKNGWNCHCIVIQVLARKYEKSDSSKAIEAGEKATTQIGKDGKNRLEIFRFNPAKEKVIFPPTHPYNKVKGAKVVKEELSKNIEDRTKRKEKDNEIKEWAKKNIPEIGKNVKLKNFITGEVKISRSSIKSIGDHFTNVDLKEVAKHIVSNLTNCKHIESAPLNKESLNYEKKIRQGVTQFHYYEFEWNNQKFRLNTEEISNQFEKPYSVNLIIKK